MNDKHFYIVWSPESHLPPTKTWSTQREAHEVAVIMAQRHPSQRFIVCRALSVSKAVSVETEHLA